jgi:hypothetical protein
VAAGRSPGVDLTAVHCPVAVAAVAVAAGPMVDAVGAVVLGVGRRTVGARVARRGCIASVGQGCIARIGSFGIGDSVLDRQMTGRTRGAVVEVAGNRLMERRHMIVEETCRVVGWVL